MLRIQGKAIFSFCALVSILFVLRCFRHNFHLFSCCSMCLPSWNFSLNVLRQSTILCSVGCSGGHVAFLSGTRDERKKARDYLLWLFEQRRQSADESQRTGHCTRNVQSSIPRVVTLWRSDDSFICLLGCLTLGCELIEKGWH